MNRGLLLCPVLVLLALFSSALANDVSVSSIKVDESLVFFRTTAWFDEGNDEWHVPIHGWVFEPEDSVTRKTIFSAILKNEFGLVPTDETEANYTRRLNLLIADNERGKRIVVDIGGRHYVMPPSKVNGHFETTLKIPATELAESVADGVLRYTAVTRKNEPRTFQGETRLVGPAGLSVISDIDDTVKISNVTDRTRLLEHTFLLDFAAVPGMADTYARWAAEDTSFHFVSSSPWQLYQPLQEFLDASGFPWSAFSLKPVRFRDSSLFNLFKKGTETKPAAIEKILLRFPQRKFVLVGDSGEQDPEVYASLIEKFPQQIQKLYIRNVSGESADNARFKSVFADIDPSCWQLFDDPQALELPRRIRIAN